MINKYDYLLVKTKRICIQIEKARPKSAAMARLKTHKRNNEVFIGSSSFEINCLGSHKRWATAGKPINFLETSCSKKRIEPSCFSPIEKKKNVIIPD
ncbi:hypothetical protein CEXT_600461 [Caerostris extrusa]|uniref:Uncharacterized protein n=1 Tax=Caerostris extrusa TaxID=172846 RepID=A0AAV4XTD1_CAEEX|nr:hypothetical protein CEXT_600461 [Caerostris extrusa]